ncbi:hypothetical protein [Streptomyces sp. NPDC091278]|uniref:hypothetical protein n=1 Tax=Streptomyces sp. NPDC091278 TaxID=3155301 RepID=UPI00344B78AB
MAYEVIEVEFRTELHAHWSVFFDHLRVPWVYEPVTFYGDKGSPCTPAFWLPRERIWFTAEVQAPAWWGRFAMAAEGCDEWLQGWDEEAGRCPPVDVPKQWRGMTLLAEGPFFPEDVPGIGSWGRPDPWSGPWQSYEANGMRAYDDEPYQWTMCPQCGLFGAEFCGYAERLSCDCLDSDEHAKVANGSDERLLAAYRAAMSETWPHEADAGQSPTLRWPTVREALIRQPGATAAAGICAGACRPAAQQVRQVQRHPLTSQESEGSGTLCSACPGFVCGRCGEQPTAAADVPCRTCEPVVLLTENQVRQHLNGVVAKLSAATGTHGRRINTIINDSINVKTRAGISLAQLGAALTNAERWLDDLESMPVDLSAPVDEDPDTLHGPELRKLLTTYVGPLARMSGEPIPSTQIRLNNWMGVYQRGEASVEQLRDAIVQARTWLKDPGSYRAYIHPEPPGPGGLPAPVQTKNAAADTSCVLCAAAVAAGELVGRLPRPREPYVPMVWLCAHCLFDRRTSPRLADVVLRVFHHTFSGSNTTPLNTAEAAVLLEVLLPIPLTGDDEHLQEAISVLRRGLDDADPVMSLSYYPARAAVSALHAAARPLDALSGDVPVLAAVTQHLDEWHHNPQNIGKDAYRSRTLWRQAVLKATPAPTVLSRQGGPFWV